IARIASATGVPCATRTSTWRSFATISSGVCLFLPIVILLRLSRAILQDGPLQRGRITLGGARLSLGRGVACAQPVVRHRGGPRALAARGRGGRGRAGRGRDQRWADLDPPGRGAGSPRRAAPALPVSLSA